MEKITDYKRQYDYPIRVVQFGEGNFLRAFWGKAIHELNKQNIFMGQICVVQPIAEGKIDVLKEQNYLYNVCLQSKDSEEIELVESIKSGINPYTDFSSYLELAKLDTLRVIISNTTEAGIVLDTEDSIDREPPQSYPCKLLLFLYIRYKEYKGIPGKGLLVFPCELIENNGSKLLDILVALCDRFNLEPDFRKWLIQENSFYNTLVDGIVTGYPAAEEGRFKDILGYEDKLIVKGETYQLMAVQGDESFRDEFPIEKAALNVAWTDDLDSYRLIKVRMMNGLQTVMALCGFLAGLNTEREALNHPVIGKFIKQGLYNEIMPTLEYSNEVKDEFADRMFDRLNNPHIEHLLKDINLNSFSKFQSRIQPSIAFWNYECESHQYILFSTAVLLSFYMIIDYEDGIYYAQCCGLKYPVFDTPANLRILFDLKTEAIENDSSNEEICKAVFNSKDLWLELPGFSSREIRIVADIMDNIAEIGVVETIKQLTAGRADESIRDK